MVMDFAFYGRQALIKSSGDVCRNSEELVQSKLFSTVVGKFLADLRSKDSPFLAILPQGVGEEKQNQATVRILQKLSSQTKEEVLKGSKDYDSFFKDSSLLYQFVEMLYNFWRAYERFFVLYAEKEAFHKKPYSSFTDTIDLINNLARKVYRDVCQNISGTHPRIFRQVPAGAKVGLIVNKQDSGLPSDYESLSAVPLVKQMLIEPPMIIDPPMNKRKGKFLRVDSNPLAGLSFDSQDWICYPVIVADLLVYLYVHNKFIGLGTAVANLFELADEADLNKKPDAIYAYGVDPVHLEKYGEIPLAFYEDEKNDLFAAAVPGSDDYGYFGYIKKMMLTIHNSIMMKRGRMPVHGAMVKISLKNGKRANIIVIGDSGAGKSESLEAFRVLSEDYLRDMVVIFDDMGSLTVEGDKVIAYGTETGAFVRLDDLQPGYAFGNMDRSIIMSPQKINARAVLPITTLEAVQGGEEIDYFLYANNYEEIDEDNPYLERFTDVEDAIEVFREGARMAKGTTSEKGLVHTYFANIFGPVQYKDVHDKLADKYFKALFDTNVYVGQIRTKLGIEGCETSGPQDAAKALFELIMKD